MNPLIYENSPKFQDRERFYRILYDHCDRNGVLLETQRAMVEPLGITYQGVSTIITEFVAMGIIEKKGHTFRCLYEPDQIPWGPTFNEHRRRYRDAVIAEESK